MNIGQLSDLSVSRALLRVSFIESGNAPIVIEAEYKQSGKVRRSLLKDESGQVISCKNLKAAYDLCLKADLHEAYLVQIVPDEEACHSAYADYHKDTIPLRF
jgi:hypothetical protein